MTIQLPSDFRPYTAPPKRSIALRLSSVVIVAGLLAALVTISGLELFRESASLFNASIIFGAIFLASVFFAQLIFHINSDRELDAIYAAEDKFSTDNAEWITGVFIPWVQENTSVLIDEQSARVILTYQNLSISDATANEFHTLVLTEGDDHNLSIVSQTTSERV